MRETWVSSLGWEDHLEKGTATHSSILDFGNDLFPQKKKKKRFFPSAILILWQHFSLMTTFLWYQIIIKKKATLPMGISLYDCKMKRPSSPPHHDITAGGCPLFTLASDRAAIKWTVVYLEFWDRGRSKNSPKRYEKVCVRVTFPVKWSFRVNQITRVAFKKLKPLT